MANFTILEDKDPWEVGTIIGFGVADATMVWMQQHGLLANRRSCLRCNSNMLMQNKSSVIDGKAWRCSDRGCRTIMSVRKDSFFEKSNLKLEQCLKICFCWARDHSHDTIRQDCRITEPTVVDWCQFLREVFSQDLIANSSPIGGVGHIVAIEETLVARRKPAANQHGRLVPAQWLFGGIDLQTREVFMELVDSRDQQTLQPIILANIAPGTEIHSDEWGAYIGLTGLGYTHRTVNHSRWFVAPNGVHTNDIESLWSAGKSRFKRMHGARRTFISSYLD